MTRITNLDRPEDLERILVFCVRKGYADEKRSKPVMTGKELVAFCHILHTFKYRNGHVYAMKAAYTAGRFSAKHNPN